jgi:hypothetical protein
MLFKSCHIAADRCSAILPAIALYQGWLQVGYATLYTMAPVFSLVLDRDVNEDLALLYPELYKELTKVGPVWVVISVTRSQ